MPLKINVGLNRKASKDYQSTGLSVNIEAELDATLLARPDELQRQVANLYAQAHEALERQAGEPARSALPSPAASSPTPPAGRSDATPRWTRRPAAAPPAPPTPAATLPPATASQRRAIAAIAQSQGLDPQAVAGSIGFDLHTLSRGDASRLIDHLKSLPSSHSPSAERRAA